MIGLGVIVRDFQSQVLGSLRVGKIAFSSAFLAEAIGLLAAVNFCKAMEFTHITLKGDALRVIRILKKEDDDWGEGGCIIQDARAILDTFAN